MSTTPPEEPTQNATERLTTQQTQPTLPLPNAPLAPQAAFAQHPEAPGFDAQYAYQAQPPVATTVKDTNTYALVSVIVAFLMPLAGIIFGHMGLNQIKRTGDAGRGLALTAVIYGYCMFALGALFIVLYIGFIAVAIGAISSGSSYS